MRCLMEFLTFMHSKGLTHRDLKPENIMLSSRGTDAVIKVIDFGTSDFCPDGHRLFHKFGTPLYVAPEVSCCVHLSVMYFVSVRLSVSSALSVSFCWHMLSCSCPYLSLCVYDGANCLNCCPCCTADRPAASLGKTWASILMPSAAQASTHDQPLPSSVLSAVHPVPLIP